MHRWVVFFSVWAIAALASGNTKPLNENEEVRFGDPDQIHNPMPLNPEFSPDGIQKPEPIILPEIDENSENPMPFHDVDESVHIPVDMPPFSDLDVDQPLNDANTDDESYYSNDELESEEDDYEPVQLNSFPSQDEIKNPMPLNPDPWDGEGDAPLWRENATVREARAIAPPTYHGGRVLINPINVYIVWYGSWGNLGGDQEMIEYFFENIQSSAWWQMATRYTQNKNGVITPVTPNVRLAGAVQAPLSHGKSLASPQVVYNIVNNVLDINLLPMDTDGVYFVLTAPNIAVTNFCVNFCGWHSGFNYRGNQILVSMVPHSASSTKGATCRTNVGGSGFGFGASVGGYNMVNVIAHELVESATDPIGNAWYRTSDHYENADMCAWKFGTVKKVSNYNYNVQLGSKYFLIQQFYDLKSGRCASA